MCKQGYVGRCTKATYIAVKDMPYFFDYKAVTIIRRGCSWGGHEKKT